MNHEDTHFMKLRYFATVVLLALTTVAAHAQTGQFGFYLNPIGIRASNSYADSGPYAFLGQNSTSAIFYGVNFGLLYDFPSVTKLTFGVDMRDSILHANNAGMNNFLIGPRIVAKPFKRPASVYIEPVVGLGVTRAPGAILHTRKVEYGAYAGLDYTIYKHIDWRVVEIGYTSVETQSSETVGGTAAVPSTAMINFSTGFVFHFP
jgi:hypothetical protein